MPSLPVIGQTPWAQDLLDWLAVAHNLDGTQKPLFDYWQEGDPGAVGYKKTWFKESTNQASYRNAANTAWVFFSSSGGGAPAGSSVIDSLGNQVIDSLGNTVIS